MKSKFHGNRCILCGRECVPATDAFGEPYMGCPVCRVNAPELKRLTATTEPASERGEGDP